MIQTDAFTKSTGKIEQPSPEQIAFVVRELRGYFGWKRVGTRR